MKDEGGDTTMTHPGLPVLNPSIPEENEANEKSHSSSNKVGNVADRVPLLSRLDGQQIHCQDARHQQNSAEPDNFAKSGCRCVMVPHTLAQYQGVLAQNCKMSQVLRVCTRKSEKAHDLGIFSRGLKVGLGI